MGSRKIERRSPLDICQAGPRAHLLYIQEGLPPRTTLTATVSLGSPDDWAPDEPSTIWTGLEADGGVSPGEPPRAPTYIELTPAQRGLYLRWLGERTLQPKVSVSYAMLYYYGLERRIFGSHHRQAVAEILTLRRLFSDSLLHLLSCQALCCGWLFHRSNGCIAEWISREQPVTAPPDFTEALAWLLLASEAPFTPPWQWIFRWVQRKRKPWTKVTPRIGDRIQALLQEESLLDRFKRMPPALKPNRQFQWKLGNSSRSFQSLTPLALDFPGSLHDAAFLAPFREACRKEEQSAIRERRVQKTKLAIEEEERWRMQREEEWAEEAWSTFLRGGTTKHVRRA